MYASGRPDSTISTRVRSARLSVASVIERPGAWRLVHRRAPTGSCQLEEDVGVNHREGDRLYLRAPPPECHTAGFPRLRRATSRGFAMSFWISAGGSPAAALSMSPPRSEEHTSELQS